KDIVTYDASAGMSSIRTDEGIPWVIAVDGGCRHRKGKSISSYGIFFGPESPYNRYARVPKGLPQTTDGAEYHAAREAIDIAMQQISKYASNKVEEIVIQSDSDSVVAGLTEYVWRWQINGWRTKHGHPIESTQIIKDLHILVHKAATEYGVRIKFWKVPRQYNEEADSLATLGLD
ncbi:ribonuclease H-like domain-containing protein, partial [Halenospora varia]